MNVISPEELSRGLLTRVNLEAFLPSKEGQISGVVPVYKEWGKTPLETLERLRQTYPALTKVPLSYAGRLDPLAEGVLLVLVGETNKDRERYLHLDKTYEVEILFGIKTDTGDLFGIPKYPPMTNISDEDEVAIKNISNTFDLFIGTHQFPYPVYSSKTIQGKPLFQWMMEGRISEIEIPKTDIEIFSIDKIVNDQVEPGCIPRVVASDVLYKVEKALQEVKGDFRFEEIRDAWNKALSSNLSASFPLIKIKCTCSSGTYMRVLAEEIGKRIGKNVPALAYSIKRINVGNIGLDNLV